MGTISGLHPLNLIGGSTTAFVRS